MSQNSRQRCSGQQSMVEMYGQLSLKDRLGLARRERDDSDHKEEDITQVQHVSEQDHVTPTLTERRHRFQYVMHWLCHIHMTIHTFIGEYLIRGSNHVLIPCHSPGKTLSTKKRESQIQNWYDARHETYDDMSDRLCLIERIL